MSRLFDVPTLVDIVSMSPSSRCKVPFTRDSRLSSDIEQASEHSDRLGILQDRDQRRAVQKDPPGDISDLCDLRYDLVVLSCCGSKSANSPRSLLSYYHTQSLVKAHT